jgi:uncharacterized protein YxjI
MALERFGYDRYLIDQLVRPVVNLYRITPLAAGEAPAGGPVAFVRQKRMAIREDIRFFADESESEELFRIKARSVLDIGGSRYDVLAADGAAIGRLEHVFGKSLFRSTWRIVGAEESEVAVARERSQVLAIARRVVDFLPYGEWVPIPYDFVFHGPGGDGDLGHFTRKFLSVRDRYVLDVSNDREQRLDRRLALALGIALDALQNR